jgi:hypothetical protein
MRPIPQACLSLLLPLIVALPPGCAARPTSPYAHLDPEAARELARQVQFRRDADLTDDLAVFAVRPPRSVLLLSAGDAHGAFGCGLLAGWREASDSGDLPPADRRPAFDVVTGVSTGALMAPFAFLGEPRDDDTLRDVYTHLSDADVMTGPFTPGKPDSVFDTIPLRRLIERQVTDEAIRRIAAAHRRGRRLYVATADLDTGALVVWPLSRIAADAAPPDDSLADARRPVDPAGAARFRDVMLAAASIPVIFPPVEIDGGLHVDAGIREAIFVRKAMLGPDHGPRGERPTVYAIVNGTLRTQPQAVGDHLFAIGLRSLEIYTESLLLFNLRDAAHVAAAHDPPFRFRWATEPDHLSDHPSSGKMFDRDEMRKLYDAGRTAGAANSWHEGVPGD